MTRRALRIRHYIGTIVAACSLGGLLLAFELAFLFQALERRSTELSEGTSTLSAVTHLRGETEEWLRDVRSSLGNAALLQGVGESLSALLVQLEKLKEATGAEQAADDLERLREQLLDAVEGPKLSLRTRPGTQLVERDRAEDE